MLEKDPNQRFDINEVLKESILKQKILLKVLRIFCFNLKCIYDIYLILTIKKTSFKER